MYSVFVAAPDAGRADELKSALAEADGQFTICGQAEESEAALAGVLASRAEVLLADEGMPPLDGTDLADAAAGVRGRLLVVRTGRGEDPSVLRAGSITLHAGTLADVLQETAAELGRRPAASGEGLSPEETMRLMVVRHLLLGERSTAEILEEADAAGLALGGRCYVLVALHFEAAKLLPDPAPFRKLLHGRRDVLPYSDGRSRLTLLVIADDRQRAAAEAKETLNACLGLFRASDTTATAVVGAALDRLQTVPRACAAAEAMLAQLHAAHPGTVADVSEVPGLSRSAVPWSVTFSGLHEQKLQRIAAADLPALLSSFLSRTGEEQLSSVLHRFYLLADMLTAAVRVVTAASPNAPLAELTAGLSGAFEVFLAASTRESFEQNALALLGRAVELRDRHSARPQAPDVLERALAFMRENYGQSDMSLLQTAQHVGFSATHFSTVFSQRMGTTFIDHLTSLRMERAKELLATSDRKLAGIAMEIGYSDPNYFSHVFKKREGISPTEYRRRRREDVSG